MKNQQAKQLLDRYLEGQCSPEEKMQVEQAYNLEIKSGQIQRTEQAYLKMKSEIWDSMQKEGIYFKSPVKLWPRRIAVAASLLIILGLGAYFYLGSTKPFMHSVYVNDVDPGGNKAYLTLSDGKRVSLNDALNGSIAAQTGVEISKSKDGQLVYHVRDENKSAAAEFNTLETPKGGMYTIVLPDGSKVFLNAASTLKYPTSFAKASERRVTLNGEAYMEIHKDRKHPFIVETRQQQIEVLGTHFNINSYADEGNTKTTLLEGRVKVTGRFTALKTKEVVLAPGQQAALDSSDQFLVKNADLEETIAWKEGTFIFNNEGIESIMRKISRWYNVEVTYQGKITDEGFNGIISRNKSISQVLSVLDKTKGVHFKVEGRRITVME